MRFSPLHRLFTTLIFAEKSTEPAKSMASPIHPRRRSNIKNIYVPIRLGAVPLVSKTNSVILLSLFCCLSMLYRLAFIFSMARRNSAAQCRAGRNSTNPGKSEKFSYWKYCNKIACIFSVLVALYRSGRWCPRWCYLSGLAVAGSAGVCCAACVPLVVLVLLWAGGDLENNVQDLARAVFCLGFLEKIGQKSFLGRKVGRRRNVYALTGSQDLIQPF